MTTFKAGFFPPPELLFPPAQDGLHPNNEELSSVLGLTWDSRLCLLHEPEPALQIWGISFLTAFPVVTWPLQGLQKEGFLTPCALLEGEVATPLF